MKKERIKGKAQEVEGDVKERLGGASKDRSKQAEGWLENKEGRIREGIGKAKEDLEHRRERSDPERGP